MQVRLLNLVVIVFLVLVLSFVFHPAAAIVPGGCPDAMINYWPLDNPDQISDIAGIQTTARCPLDLNNEKVNFGTMYCSDPAYCSNPYSFDPAVVENCSADKTTVETLGYVQCLDPGHPQLGTLNCPLSSQGKIGGAMLFNDKTGLAIPAGDTVFNKWGAADSFTIESWIKTGYTASTQMIIGRHGLSGTATWWVGVSGYDYTPPLNRAAFYLRDNWDDGFQVVGTTDIADDKWHHIVAVKDANRIMIFVDGRNEGQSVTNYQTGFDTAAADLYIGWLNMWEGGGFHFNGIIDEPALYDRALSPDEIADHYTRGNAGSGYCAVYIGKSGTLLDFGTVLVGKVSPPYQVTLTNTGLGPVSTGPVSITGASSSQFTIEEETCSAQPLAPGSTCKATVLFAPRIKGRLNADLSIPTNAPELPEIKTSLSGLSFLNILPSSPQLISPEEGETGIDTTVTFAWNEADNPGNTPLTYSLYYCEDPTFKSCAPVEVVPSDNKEVHYVMVLGGIGGIGGIGLLGLLFHYGRRKLL